MPGVDKNEITYVSFRQRTDVVSTLRHYAQHMDREIKSIASDRPPLWGSLAWTSPSHPEVCHILHTGNEHIPASAFGLVYDRLVGSYTSTFDLSAGAFTAQVDELYAALRNLDDVVAAGTGTIKLSSGKPYIYRAKSAIYVRSSIMRVARNKKA
jgi:hypothetical protein